MTEYSVKRGHSDQAATDAGTTVRILADRGERVTVQIGEETMELEVRALPDGRTAVIGPGGRHVFRTFMDRKQIVVVEGSTQRRYDVVDARDQWLHAAAGRAGAAGGRITASMPGRVVRIPVQVGDVVAPNGVVAVLEAMKMENDVRTIGGGIVASIVVLEGATVENGAILMHLEAAS
jgi:biotin carboxyl carrier protein